VQFDGFLRAGPVESIDDLGGLDAAHFPEKPGFTFVSQVAELNEMLG